MFNAMELQMVFKLNRMHFYLIIWTCKNSIEPLECCFNFSISTFLPLNATMICKRNTEFNRILYVCSFQNVSLIRTEENGINASYITKRYDTNRICWSNGLISLPESYQNFIDFLRDQMHWTLVNQNFCSVQKQLINRRLISISYRLLMLEMQFIQSNGVFSGRQRKKKESKTLIQFYHNWIHSVAMFSFLYEM